MPATALNKRGTLCWLVQVKVQTSPKGTFPVNFGQAWGKMSASPAEYK